MSEGILRMEIRDAIADIHRRLDALDQAVARLERIKADDLIAQHGSDGAPEPRPSPGEWSNPGDKVQCVTSRYPKWYSPGEVYEMINNTQFIDRAGDAVNGCYGTFIPYVEQSKVQKLHIATGAPVPPEFPWHDHDGSDKCPVPKRRRGEMIEIAWMGWVSNCRASDAVEWRCVTRWRYTQPDTKPRKWQLVGSLMPSGDGDIRRFNGIWYRVRT